MDTRELYLVDGHAHLEELDDLPESLQEAKEAGVCGILAVGMDIESNKKGSSDRRGQCSVRLSGSGLSPMAN